MKHADGKALSPH